MKRMLLFSSNLTLMLFLFLNVTAWGADPMVTQTLTLNPGWNAVYLEVQPLSNSPAQVFNGLPNGSSVWAWLGKDDSVQFIQDPSESPVNKPKWLAIFTVADEVELTNLYAITANSAYLIQIPAGLPPMTLTVTGRPTIRHKGWVPDSFNLVGFGFTSTPPTFASFFASSSSHKDQAIYRLNNVSGAWEMLNNPAAATMRSGEAFWVYCKSGSDYQGPLMVEANNADGLDFGAGITLLTLELKNVSSSNKTVSVAQLSAPNPEALAYRRYDAAIGRILTEPLSGMAPITVKAGGSSVITLAAQRGSFSGSAAWVLEFTDGQGSRVRVPVTATSNPINSSGLWAGAATLNKVSQLSDSGPAPDFTNGEAKPTTAELTLNLILHQDKFGQVRLLKQVIMMYKDRTLNPDGSVATNGRPVALTKDSLISNYSGVTQRDGAKVGRRLSAVGFDYSQSVDTDFDNTALKCSGSISTTVACQLILKSSQPTNPFLHRYHPDHDNLTPDYAPYPPDYALYKQEVNNIARDVTLEFDPTPKENPDNPPPGWGVSILGGTYTEYIRGLAKGPIKVQGNFTLRLASDVDSLNE